jgi:NitT/TauT family transport system permease protein
VKPRASGITIRKPIPRTTSFVLGIAVWVVFFLAWHVAVVTESVNTLLVPAPGTVLATIVNLFVEGDFIKDIGISIYRILVSFLLACAVAVPIGILMGTYARTEAFVNSFVSAWRYLPAPAFIPILLMWLGTGEGPKIALLFIGVVFFLITLIMDYTKQVRIELIETSLTLGASENQVLWSVIIPAVMPNIITAMRQMLAVSWTYLVIAEIVASTTGIGAMMMRARRFLHTDEIMAGIVIIGILGLMFDLLFRWLHRFLFKYLYVQN